VLERSGEQQRGKGAALADAIGRLEWSSCDAVAIVDADVLVGREFFAAMDRALPDSDGVLQGYDGISNADESMLTRLMDVTLVMKNLLYNAGKSALGFAPLLQGTGMVFARELLVQRGWQAHGLSEDVEEGLRWVADGHRVRSVPDAHIHAQEAASLQQARSQRERWARGIHQLRAGARRMLGRALARRDWVLAEAALSALLPSYSKHMNLTLLAAALLGTASLLAAQPGAAWAWALLGLALGLQLAEFGLALWIMRAGWRQLASLALAPLFLAWKAALDLRVWLGSGSSAWVRTARHQPR
jgi:cellulose synthase/poly-beta-1,6-N-acetylglucosamine synthase-like glycosyltransferase